MSLRRLLRTHLAPYRRMLWVVVVLQAIQTFAALTLPTINEEFPELQSTDSAHCDQLEELKDVTYFCLEEIVFGDYAEPALRAMNWDGRFLVIGFAAGPMNDCRAPATSTCTLM